MTADNLEERLNIIRKAYAQKLPEKIQEIDNLWKELQQGWDQEQLKALHRHIHKLCGSGTTMGYRSVSETAFQVDSVLKILLKSSLAPTPEQNSQIQVHLNGLKQACSDAVEVSAQI